VRERVVALITARFGTAVWPHLFRDCAVTALALGDPGQVHAAAALLGHRDPTMAERHYNASTSLEAGRRHAAALGARRRATAIGRAGR
jgi:integrase/recombinase XerD